jgi:hypothetical protein
VIGRRRTVLAAATMVVALSGGTAWAASGGVTTDAHSHATDSTDASTSSTDSTGTTMASTSTSSSTSTSTTDTTDTTDTTVADTTTTTTLQSTPIVPAPTTPQSCKPGWGYGDKNHCHSGPPGLQNDHAGKHNS